MHCTNCGTEVPSDARYCPGCGRSSPLSGGPAGGKPKLSGCGMIALVAGALLVAAMIFGGGKKEAAAVDPTVAAAQAKACDDILNDLVRKGAIKTRPAANRIDVQDRDWAMLPADQKKMIAAGVRCAAGGVGSDDYGVVYGYRSGKRLAMATNVGVSLE
jgi:hypothetical protein